MNSFDRYGEIVAPFIEDQGKLIKLAGGPPSLPKKYWRVLWAVTMEVLERKELYDSSGIGPKIYWVIGDNSVGDLLREMEQLGLVRLVLGTFYELTDVGKKYL